MISMSATKHCMMDPIHIFPGRHLCLGLCGYVGVTAVSIAHCTQLHDFIININILHQQGVGLIPKYIF